MELRHLRYFATVAETCHFGRAAERLHIAQPALSHAVRQLESELNVALFNRTTRQVSLTAAGEFLQGEAARILSTVDDAVRGVRRLAEGRAGLVRLGLTGTASYSHLPQLARLLQRELPGVALDVRTDMLTPEQCEALRRGTLDLGIMRPPAVGGSIALTAFESEPLILVVAAGHRLAHHPAVSMNDLRSEPFVTYANPRSSVNEAVMRACRAADFAPHREHQAAGTSALLALVAAGLGIALAPAGIRALSLDGVVFNDVAGAGSIDLALGRRADETNPLIDAIHHLLAAQARAGALRPHLAARDSQ